MKYSIDDELSVVAQCQLAGIARSEVVEGKIEEVDEFELLLLRLLDEEYTRHPLLFGLQIVVVWLRYKGHTVNRKRVQRLMRILGCVRWLQVLIPAKVILNTRFIPISFEA